MASKKGLTEMFATSLNFSKIVHDHLFCTWRLIPSNWKRVGSLNHPHRVRQPNDWGAGPPTLRNEQLHNMLAKQTIRNKIKPRQSQMQAKNNKSRQHYNTVNENTTRHIYAKHIWHNELMRTSIIHSTIQ